MASRHLAREVRRSSAPSRRKPSCAAAMAFATRLRRCLGDMADEAAVDRRKSCTTDAVLLLAGDERGGGHRAPRRRDCGDAVRSTRLVVAEFEALRELALGQVKVERQRQFCRARGGRRRRSALAAGAEGSGSELRDRGPSRRRKNWRHSPTAGAPDRREDRDRCRPAHRCGRDFRNACSRNAR